MRGARGIVLLVVVVFLGSASAAEARNVQGYIPVDGAKLRYTVSLPQGPGPFPVALNYDGYCAGTGALTCNDRQVSQALLDAGYAVVGVSIRGTGCSTGTFELRTPAEAADGAAAVEWAARQPWSTGRVGMYGDSFPGLTQPGVAALHPRGLAALAPFQIANDLYRDVAYPGGMSNFLFAVLWGVFNQPFNSASGGLQQANDKGECAPQVVANAVNGLSRNILLLGLQHPWDDSFWKSKSAMAHASRITVPTFGCASWQDDEVSSRAGWTFFPRIKPKLLWFVGMNGFHSQCEVNTPLMVKQVVRFFDRFVRGKRNGFEKTPRAQIWHEAHRAAGADNAPSWVTKFDRWPPRTHNSSLRLGGPPQSYTALQVGQPNEDGAIAGQQNIGWKLPIGNSTQWTTPPLTRDIEVLGPAGANLTIRSTVNEAALQATIAELRPDGQETYVARGWLKASHRAIDTAAASAVDPVHTHRLADQRPLVPNKDTSVRVGVYPFGHVFRKGSRIRLIIDPPSITGGWAMDTSLVLPGRTTVVGGKLVVPIVARGRARKPLPRCDTLLNQPCRKAARGGGTLSAPALRK